jgi:hypothetical protein
MSTIVPNPTAALTFTTSTPAEGLRHWDLRGPLGLVRFETADTLGFRTASIYVHYANVPEGGEVEDCDVCGGGWHDALSNSLARQLREDWEGAARHDAVIRTELTRWYVDLFGRQS